MQSKVRAIPDSGTYNLRAESYEFLIVERRCPFKKTTGGVATVARKKTDAHYFFHFDSWNQAFRKSRHDFVRLSSLVTLTTWTS